MLRSRSALFIATLFSVAIFTSCASEPQKPAAPPDTRKADEAAIRAASAEWAKASEARDLEKAVSYYADDAVFLVDKGALVKGKDAIRMVWKDILAPNAPKLTFSAIFVEVARSGDIGYEYGTAEFTSADKKGKPVVEQAKYATVWKKQPNGTWKAVVDMDNTGI